MHAGRAPHWQVPVAEQLSAVVRSHATHVPPPTPQVASEFGVQTPVAQQPVGQLVALQVQAPAMHTEPLPQDTLPPHVQAPLVGSQPSLIVALQGTHAWPPTPQVATAGVRQTPLAQHPLGQDCALQTQAPLTQTVPAPHEGDAPH